MKTSTTNTWSKAANDQRRIVETTTNILREATTACLDLLVKAQHSTGIHKVRAVGGFKDAASGYAVELRWSEKGDHWWNPQQKLTLSISNGSSSVYLRGDVLGDHFHNIYASHAADEKLQALITSLAESLAYKYIR